MFVNSIGALVVCSEQASLVTPPTNVEAKGSVMDEKCEIIAE